MSAVVVACFPQNCILFLGGLAVWGAACAFVATPLGNFASYAATLAGYTTAIIAGDLFGAAGSVDADPAFLLAVARDSEICLGIVCAGLVLAGTDPGSARRRLAVQFADLSAAIAAGFTRTLEMAGWEFADAQLVHREFVRRVVALDPVIDQALRESAQIRYHSPMLQSAVDGLFTARSAWRAIADHVSGLPAGETRQEATAVLECVPPQLRSTSQTGTMERWSSNPVALHKLCELTVRRLTVAASACRRDGQGRHRHRGCAQRPRVARRRAGTSHSASQHQTRSCARLAASGGQCRPRFRCDRRHFSILGCHRLAGRVFVTPVSLMLVVAGWPGPRAGLPLGSGWCVMCGTLALFQLSTCVIVPSSIVWSSARWGRYA
jgi:hypothetical protein